jgi:hypothetical protein
MVREGAPGDKSCRFGTLLGLCAACREAAEDLEKDYNTEDPENHRVSRSGPCRLDVLFDPGFGSA